MALRIVEEECIEVGAGRYRIVVESTNAEDFETNEPMRLAARYAREKFPFIRGVSPNGNVFPVLDENILKGLLPSKQASNQSEGTSEKVLLTEKRWRKEFIAYSEPGMY